MILSDSPTRTACVVLVFLSACIYFVYDERIVIHDHRGQPFSMLRVAHAGGGLNDQNVYTNSYEALDQNLAKGFRYFELDFVYTSDNHLVCLHDWEGNFEHIFKLPRGQRLTLEEFRERTRANPLWRNCTLQDLVAWMNRNPAAKIVTDIKERNVEGLKRILEVLPDAHSRVIPQIYRPRHFAEVKELGYKQVIWTLYHYTRPTREILRQLRAFHGPLAITMNEDRVRSDLPGALELRGIPVYVHTINDAATARTYIRERFVDEIYTDFLDPGVEL